MNRVKRLGSKGDQGAEQAHRHIGQKNPKSARPTRLREGRTPEQDGCPKKAHLHQRIQTLVGQGRIVGHRGVPQPESGRGKKERKTHPARCRGRAGQGKQGRSYGHQQDMVENPRREESRGKGTERRHEGQDEDGHSRYARAASTRPEREKCKDSQQDGIEVPARQQLGRRRRGTAIDALPGHAIALGLRHAGRPYVTGAWSPKRQGGMVPVRLLQRGSAPRRCTVSMILAVAPFMGTQPTPKKR